MTEGCFFAVVGKAWVVHGWLADVAMYLAYGLVGISGLILLAAVAVAAGEFLVLRLLRAGGLGQTSAVAVGILLAVASAPSWGPRPQLLHFVFTALLTRILLRFRPRPRPWALLPPAPFVLSA